MMNIDIKRCKKSEDVPGHGFIKRIFIYMYCVCIVIS